MLQPLAPSATDLWEGNQLQYILAIMDCVSICFQIGSDAQRLRSIGLCNPRPMPEIAAVDYPAHNLCIFTVEVSFTSALRPVSTRISSVSMGIARQGHPQDVLSRHALLGGVSGHGGRYLHG